MAVIGKIRERSTLLVVIVGLAMAAFILGDIFKGVGPTSEEFSIGEIHGEPISEEKMREYNDRVTAIVDQYMQQGMPVSTATRKQIEDAQWKRLVMDIVYGREIALLGLAVTKEELTDLVHGDSTYVSQSIKSIPVSYLVNLLFIL
jgi:peptidyl-prolyl cis-trans isomerase D